MKPYDQAVELAREHQAGRIYPINCVRIHNRDESLEHYLMKCLIAKGLTEKKQQWMSEFDFRGRVCDLWNLSQDTIIEVESEPTTKSVDLKKKQYKEHTDLFIIDLKDEPEFIKACELLEKIKDRIILRLGL
jgi:hypothetical protein